MCAQQTMDHLTDRDLYVNLIATLGDRYIFTLKDIENQHFTLKNEPMILKCVYGIIIWMSEPIVTVNTIQRIIRLIDLTHKKGLTFTVYDTPHLMIGDIVKLKDVLIVCEEQSVSYQCLDEQNIHVIFTLVYDFEGENKIKNRRLEERGIFQELHDKFIVHKLEDWISHQIYSQYSLSNLSSQDDPILLSGQILALQKQDSSFILTFWDGSNPNYDIINPSSSKQYLYFNEDYPLSYKRVVYIKVISTSYLNLYSFSLKQGNDLYLLTPVKLDQINSTSKYTLTIDLTQANNCLKHIERCSILGRLLIKRMSTVADIMRKVLR